MSIIFGSARQNGIIVENLDGAIEHWVDEVGAGPFYVLRHVPLDYFIYRGQPSNPDISVALGNVGDLQIELIEQHNEEPSPYLHFRKKKGAGLHHISSWTAQYDADLTRIRARGFVPDCEGRITASASFAYFGADAVDGSAYEISDLGTDNEYGAVHDIVRHAAADWDGSEPVRSLW